MKKLVLVLFLTLFTVSIFGGAKYITQEMANKAESVYENVWKSWDYEAFKRTVTYDTINEVMFEITIKLPAEKDTKETKSNYISITQIIPPEDWLLEDYFENTLLVLEKFLFKVGWSGIIPIARSELKEIFEKTIVGQITVIFGSEETEIDFGIEEKMGKLYIEIIEY